MVPCGNLFFCPYTAERKRKEMKFVKRLIALSLLQTIMLESGKRRLEWKDLSFAQMHPHKLEALGSTGEAVRHS